MGEDGKMHTKEMKSGTQVECHDGVCKQVECKNGVCREMMKDEATGQLLQGQGEHKAHHKKHQRRESEHHQRKTAPQEHEMRESSQP
jgi:hypothetical protein